MPIIDFPTREDDRTTSRLRRGAFALPRSTRRVKRQVLPPPSPTISDSGSSDDGGVSSESEGEDSDDEEEKEQEKVLSTGSSQIASPSAPATVASPMPAPPNLTTSTSAASVVSSPSPSSSSSKTSAVADAASSTSTSSTSRISAVPVLSPSTTASSTLTTSAVPVPSMTATEPRHQLSPRPSQISTGSSITTTGAGFNPTAEAIQDNNRPNQTRQHKSLSHGATIALEAIGIATGIALILGICFLLFRRWKKRKARLYLDEPRPPPAMRGGWNNIWRERFKAPGNGTGPDSGGLNSDNAVDRQERLERVRTSLLGAKELNGGLMRGHSRNNSLNMSGDGVNTPTKAFLRKNSETGQMIMEKSTHLRTRSREDNGRVEIEASGQWDDPVTVAREGPSRRGSSGVGVGPGILPPISFKPTARAPDNTGEYDEQDYGWNANPYRMSELSTVRDGINPSERGSAIFSAWKGRESERERLRRDRDSRATTIAKWQSPISWVKDQVERTDTGASVNRVKPGQENRENRGMSRLPG